MSLPRAVRALSLCLLTSAGAVAAQAPAAPPPIAIRAGRLIDPETGTVSLNQIILVEGGRFTAVGASVAIPRAPGHRPLPLTVLPGLSTAQHLGLTYRRCRRATSITTPTRRVVALRAIQAASNGIRCWRAASPSCATWEQRQLRDTALRMRDGLASRANDRQLGSDRRIRGPFWPTRRCQDHNIIYPSISTPITPTRSSGGAPERALGARVIKICVDCKPWATRRRHEAVHHRSGQGGLKVGGHVQTRARAPRHRGGVWSSSRHRAQRRDAKLMPKKGSSARAPRRPFAHRAHHPGALRRMVLRLRNATTTRCRSPSRRCRLLRPRQTRRGRHRVARAGRRRRSPTRHSPGDDAKGYRVSELERGAGRSSRDWRRTSSRSPVIRWRASTRCATAVRAQMAWF